MNKHKGTNKKKKGLEEALCEFIIEKEGTFRKRHSRNTENFHMPEIISKSWV